MNKRNLTAKVHRLLLHIWIALLAGAYSPLTQNVPNLGTILFIPLYGLLAISIPELRMLNSIAVTRLFAVMFTGICFSVLFSHQPTTSAVAVIALIVNFLLACVCVALYSTGKLFRIIQQTLLAIIFCGVIMLFISPERVIHFDPLQRSSILGLPNFKALFPHKIHAGVYGVLGALISFILFRQRRNIMDAAVASVFIVFVLSTGSSLALIAAIFLSFTILFINIRTQFIPLAATSLLLLCATCLYYFDSSDWIYSLLGREKGMTGRSGIWNFGMEYIEDNLLSGGGYNVFFDPGTHSPASHMWNRMWYTAPSFHNGYLEILAESGLAGSVPFFVLLVWLLFRTFRLQRNLFLLLFWLCVSNLGASVFIKPNSLFFFLFCFTAIIAVHIDHRAVVYENHHLPGTIQTF